MMTKEKISIVGMACEFAGEASSLHGLEKVLQCGQDVTSKVDPTRWRLDAIKLPDSVIHGGFLDRDPWMFDHQVFSITPKEAACMDPQHRLLLETTYHAFEDANINPDTIAESRCGVFVGLGTQDYARLMHSSDEFFGLHGKGSIGSMAAGRITYHFNFIGPTFVVDTACSSSLVALHQAIASLKNNECDIAVVGGITLLLTVDYGLDLHNAGLLAPDGRCKSFSENADGFARGEGVGVIVLQRRSDAIRDGRRIYANILGSAINGDGKSNGITAPSKDAQQRVIISALSDAGLSPDDVSMIEAHGTGTNLGDKVEFAALEHVFHGRESVLYLGSVKGNIAHTEAAAGIAGIIKSCLSIHRQKIFPHVYGSSIKSHFIGSASKIEFASQAIDIDHLVVGVSSFGMSGSNAHIILGPEISSTATVEIKEKQDQAPLLFMSAKTPESLVKLSASYSKQIESLSDEALYTMLGQNMIARKHWHNYRVVIGGNDKNDILTHLSKFAQSDVRSDCVKRKSKIAFLFTGQGAAHLNMSKILYDKVPLYREIFDYYTKTLDNLAVLPATMSSIIFNQVLNASSYMLKTQVAQLSLFIVEFCLATLFSRLGIIPDVVIGHSLGEYAAACCVGALSFENAVAMIIARSEAIDSAHEMASGLMVQVMVQKPEMLYQIQQVNANEPEPVCWLAVSNAPSVHVISCRESARGKLLDHLKEVKLSHTVLQTTYAFHTPLLHSAVINFKSKLSEQSIQYPERVKTETQYISTVSGYDILESIDQLQSNSYWGDQIECPVCFDSAVELCRLQGITDYIELGPDTILSSLVKLSLKDDETKRAINVQSLLSKRRPSIDNFISALNICYVADRIDVSMLEHLNKSSTFMPLPLYPFDRVELIPEYVKSRSLISNQKNMISVNNMIFYAEKATVIYSLDLSDPKDAYLKDHIIDNKCVVPGAFYIEIAFIAVNYLKNIDVLQATVCDVSILSPIVVSDSGRVNIEITIIHKTDNHYALKYSEKGCADTVCELTVVTQSSKGISHHTIPSVSVTHGVDSFYRTYEACGVAYGDAFKKLKNFGRVDDTSVVAEVNIAENENKMPFQVSLLDNIFQTIGLCLNTVKKAYAPVTLQKLRWYSDIELYPSAKCYTRLTVQSDDYIEADIYVVGDDGQIILNVLGIRCYAVDFHAKKSVILKKIEFQKLDLSYSELSSRYRIGIVADENYYISKEISPFTSKSQHVVYHVLPKSNHFNDVFAVFSEFRQWINDREAEQPGYLKLVTFLCDASSADIAKAMSLSFPTEYLSIKFRALSVEGIHQSNVHFIFDESQFSYPFYIIKNGNLYVPQENKCGDAKALSTFDPEAYCLITGGLGGVGQHVVHALVTKLGVKKFIFITRQLPLSKNQKIFVDGLDAMDVSVIVKSVDLMDIEALQACFKSLPKPVKAIFHLAGIKCDSTLNAVSAHTFTSVAKVKLESARELDRLSRSLPELEYFVLFSSMAARVSSPGQLSYTFANIGLASLAEQRKYEGLPALVIDWGPWKGTGMMAGLEQQGSSSVAVSDFIAMSPQACCDELIEALAHKGSTHFAVFQKRHKIKYEQAVDSESKQLTEESAEQYIEEYLISIIIKETNYERSKIDKEFLLSELGIDSINTIRIRSEVQSHLNISIPISVMLDNINVASMTRAIFDIWKKRSIDTPEKAIEAFDISSFDDVNNKYFPFSYNQFSIWYEQKSVANNRAYHCSISWKIHGVDLHFNQLKTTWMQILEQHPLLRAVITDNDGDFGYLVLPSSQIDVEKMVVSRDIADDVDIQAQMIYLQNREIDFYSELPTKVYLLKHKNDTYLLLSSYHLVMDATSMFAIGKMIIPALCESGYSMLIPSTVGSYSEFVINQRGQTVEFEQKAKSYLLKQIFNSQDELRRFNLCYRIDVDSVDLSRGATLRIDASSQLLDIMQKVPQHNRVHICLGAWAMLLSRYSSEKEVIIGVAFNGRTHKRWAETIGHFINVLPVNIEVDEHQQCRQYLDKVKMALFELMEYQDYPLAKLLFDENIKSRLRGNALLQTYFNYFDASEMSDHFQSNSFIEPFILPQQEAQFEISLWVTRDHERYVFDIKYRSDILSHEIISCMGQHYIKLITELCQAAFEPNEQFILKQISLLSDYEQARLMRIGEGNKQHDHYVYDHFLQQVKNRPNATALEQGQVKVTYLELSAYVDQLAAVLAESSCKDGGEETVALLVSDKANIEFVISVLALWKLGFAYLPLNTKHPIERIKYMFEAAGCCKILGLDTACSNELMDYFYSIESLFMLEMFLRKNILQINILQKSQFSKRIPKQAQDLAYVLFTSGSTGLPKGVLVEHNGLIDRLLWMQHYFSFNDKSKYLQSTMLTFDISVPEFCLPLISGGVCVLFSEHDQPTAHANIAKRHSVTMISTVPSLFSILLSELSALTQLQHLITVGEVLPPAMVNLWLDTGTTAILYNLYGPTEDTIYATYYPCLEKITRGSVPIGLPCDHVIPLVLDAYGNLVPHSIVGELYLTGEGVARGYIGSIKSNPFTDNPFQHQYTRIYRTGDFVRWTSQGHLEYMGRRDNRVKLNGQLIELGEIEQQVVQKFTEVSNAVALVIPFQIAGEQVKQLVLCIMPNKVSTSSVYNYLKLHLPSYMLPWKIYNYDDFPRNSSNKIDRKALTKIVLSDFINNSDIVQSPVINQINQNDKLSPLELQLKALWEQILGRLNIQQNDNFFELGGDSLLLTKMTLLAEKKYSIRVNFAKFLKYPTLQNILSSNSLKKVEGPDEFDLCNDIKPFYLARRGRGILLTGVTGHLGIYILHTLLKNTRKHVHLIVRAATDSDALIRVQKRYRQVFSSALDLKQVSVYCGDISKNNFNLAKSDYLDLCKSVSLIIHAAAQVNHAVDYQRLKDANIIASKYIIDFSEQSNAEKLIYVSTQFTEVNALPESYLPVDTYEQFISGYEQTKYVAERLMSVAHKKGYPISTVRLPLIIDGRDSKLIRDNHFVALCIKCLQMRFFPTNKSNFNILSTDAVAKYIIEISLSGLTSAEVVHCLSEAISFKNLLLKTAEKLHIPMQEVSFKVWCDKVIECTSVDDDFYRLIPLYTTDSSPLLCTDLRPIDHGNDFNHSLGGMDILVQHLQMIYHTLPVSLV